MGRPFFVDYNFLLIATYNIFTVGDFLYLSNQKDRDFLPLFFCQRILQIWQKFLFFDFYSNQQVLIFLLSL